jgi:hypothetical protein
MMRCFATSLIRLRICLLELAIARPFMEKNQYYAQHHLRSVQEVLQKEQWTRREIEEREQQMLDWLRRRRAHL